MSQFSLFKRNAYQLFSYLSFSPPNKLGVTAPYVVAYLN